MNGSMVLEVKNTHGTKPAELVMRDGSIRQSIIATEDPKGEMVRVRKIKV